MYLEFEFCFPGLIIIYVLHGAKKTDKNKNVQRKYLPT